MPQTPYITIKFAGEELNLPQTSELPISINYDIEDDKDFRQKKASNALNITVPATVTNSGILNTLYNPDSVDTLPNEGLSKPQDVTLVAAGNELMKGKAFILKARKQFGKPLNFDINIFGDNADWVIPNKELTLHDVVSASTHVFDKATVEASWNHDGSDEAQFYVYAPVRYLTPFGDSDKKFIPTDSRPSLFLYWLLYNGFKKAGYRIISNFFDTEYFRRMVLPWIWGNLVYNDETANATRFKALQNGTVFEDSNFTTGFIRADWNWSTSPLPAFDNGGNFSQGGSPFFFINFAPTLLPTGVIHNYFFSISFFISWTIPLSGTPPSNGFLSRITVLKNGTTIITHTLANESSSTFNSNNSSATKSFSFYACVSNTDTISVVLDTKITTGGSVVEVEYSGGDFYNIPTSICYGSIIDLKRFEAFRKHKWLDLLRGVIDKFNLQINTDNAAKTVIIEPTHKYSITDNIGNPTNPGYYNGEVIDWTNKEDLSKVSEVEIFQDYEREVIMKDKEDPNDGILKLAIDRKKHDISASKYLMPERFKKGIKELSNSFFGSVMHYNHTVWMDITGVAPQLICLIPENIANTSNTESESTLQPKLAWYKGLCDRSIYGGWNWDGDDTLDLPFMFAVNYQEGGQEDPILTYCDQRIKDGVGGYVLGLGLFKRFFWQRFAIMRHGRILNASFNLNNTDVLNGLHREFKAISGHRYQLVIINNYKPLLNQTTECKMWMWHPITQKDADSTFPSSDSVLTDTLINQYDAKYSQCIALDSDIPV